MSEEYSHPAFLGARTNIYPLEGAHFSPQTVQFSPPNVEHHHISPAVRVDSPSTLHQRNASGSDSPISPRVPSIITRKPVARPIFKTSQKSMIAPIASPKSARQSRFATDFHHLGTKQRASLPPPPLLPASSPEAIYPSQSLQYDRAISQHLRSRSDGPQVYGSLPLNIVPVDSGARMPRDGFNREENFRHVNPSYGGPDASYGGPDTSYGGPDASYGGGPYTNVPLPENPMLPSENTTSRHFKSKSHYMSITLITLAIYSTIFSFVFFLIAVSKPRYGQHVMLGGSLNPNSAQLLSAIFAKTIELSFVSVFVAFLGQVLSRRALLRSSKGINIAEMTMRSWVTQPGTLLTHASSVKFAGLTFLGGLALTATVAATLYTTAADTLVSPKLRWGGFIKQAMSGVVNTSYANSSYAVKLCQTIIPPSEDPAANEATAPLSVITCSSIQTAGEGFRDFNAWMANWVQSNTSSTDPRKRPPAPSYLGLVNVNGYWNNVTGVNGWNNVTLSMPHAGLIAAAQNVSANHLLQPEQTEGYGSYDVIASITNPSLNVLCTALDKKAVIWFIKQPSTYPPNIQLRRNGTLNADIRDAYNFDPDPRFSFNPNILYDPVPTRFEAPRFAKLPEQFNSELFFSNTYFDPSIYFLIRTNRTQVTGKGKPYRSGPSYTMCSIKSFLNPYCSSEFFATSSGGNMSVNCDPGTTNPNSFYESVKNLSSRATVAYGNASKDYKYISLQLAESLNLGGGESDDDASISRLLSQLALDTSSSNLSATRPSLAEGLAVLFGSSLLTGTLGAGFHTYFQYTAAELPAVESFDAIVRTQEYASGAGATGWQPLFYVVLAAVVGFNVFCLVYFTCTHGFIIDWTDSPNMFCLLVTSPPSNSKALRDANVHGPVDTQYKLPWYVKEDGMGKLHIAEGTATAKYIEGDDDSDEEEDVEGQKIERQRKLWLPWPKRTSGGW